MSAQVKEISTNPFDGQKPGTSGLRKRVKVFQQEHYTENFIQAIFDSIDPKDQTLVIGGDGRYFSPETVQTILKIGSANGVGKFIIGKDGILSTPAASNVIRKYKAYGGILLTASHNPGGPNNDFGIKYNVSNGGPAPENVTDKIFKRTKEITSYKVLELSPVDISKIGSVKYGPTDIEIIDSVSDYLELLEGIFDFALIKSFLQSTPDFRVLFDGLNGVTGPYAKAILVDTLKLPASAVQNCVPLPDFGGGHPDPNLTYAHSLVDAVEKNNIQFGAASDGDGDRNMIYGKSAFVTPSDSVAIIADWAEECIPYFKSGIKGLARSMPTSAAIDYVAKKKGLEYFEVPTGWKFFGNLMDAGRLSICGEESFGTGSDHIREKDGIWAIVAWLNILAAANKKSPNKLMGINEILLDHYEKYGRSFFSRYDYEEVASDAAAKMVDALNARIAKRSLIGEKFRSSTGESFTVSETKNFDYTDPIDKSVSKNQGQIVRFADGSRVVFRLSGTGSQGATVRMYVEKYTTDKAQYGQDTAEGLKGLIEVALTISKLKEFLGVEKPTVITDTASVSNIMPIPDSIFKQIRQLIPPLNGTLHKGQSGRVGILGGALDYTGAPYFAAIAAQRVGADLSHVICSPTAAGAIKAYAPDLIVHPILREDKSQESVKSELTALLQRLHVLVVGPGLGREDYMQSFARLAVSIAREQKMYLVLDADALFMIGRDPGIIRDYDKAVVTPNVVEFKKLSSAVNIDPSTEPYKHAQLVSRALGGVTVLQKGAADHIAVHPSSSSSSAPQTAEIDTPGGLKRCGGQGDILSGAVGTFLAWGRCFEDGAWTTSEGTQIPSARIPFLAAVAGALVTRTTSRRAFALRGRSVITADLVGEVGGAFAEVFGEEAKGKL